MINKIKSSLNVFLLLIMSFIIAKYVNYIELYKIHVITVAGNSLIKTDDIINKITLVNNNNNFLNIDIKKIQKEINNNPYIESSKVYKSLPPKLNIIIKEISPLALIELNETIYFIDYRYNKIKSNNSSLNYFSVPIITNATSEIIDYKRYALLLNKIKNENNIFYNSINELVITNKSTVIKISGNTKIILDKNKEINNTIKLLSFLDTIKGHKKIYDYKYVDLSIPKQVIVKENRKI